MCRRPEHHRQEDIRREAAQQGAMRETAERQRREQEERMMAFQAEANKRQQEAMAAIALANRQPVRTGATESAGTPIMKTRQKKDTSTLASLRINRTPGYNIGGMGTSGTNVG